MSARGSCPRGLGASFAFAINAALVAALLFVSVAYASDAPPYRPESDRANTGVTPTGYIPFDGMTANGSRIGGFGSYYIRWYPNGPADTSVAITCAAGSFFAGGDLNFYLDRSGPCAGQTNTGRVEYFEIGDSQYWDAIQGTINGDDWQRTTFGPPPCTVNCFSNVIFLPGIESSRLYRPQVIHNPEKKLWEPSSNTDVEELFLDSSGSTIGRDIYTKRGAVLDELPVFGQNIYKSLLLNLDSLKTQGLINDWEAIPYDWRLSIQEILSNGGSVDSEIHYSGNHAATTSPYIIQQLRQLAKTSKTHKVTIIAHSNGGLVAKRLVQLLGDDAPSLIDKLIFVAVPQVGTPMALAADLHGHDQALLKGLIMTDSVARTFANNSPMAHHLLPSAGYFTSVAEPVIRIDSSLPDWISRYGTAIQSASILDSFLRDTFGRVDPLTGDNSRPVTMNGTLLTYADSLHQSLDSWTPPVGVHLIQIAGWGVPTTISGITYKQSHENVTYEPNFTLDGDGTVVVPSALWTSTSAGTTTNYWVNLNEYNRTINKLVNGRIQDATHSDILEIDKVLNFISDSLINRNQPIETYSYFSAIEPSSADQNHRLQFSLHSPLSLNIYDSQGHHTGISTTTGLVEEQIPGSYFAEFGDTKYIFSDASSPVHIVMEGYDDGQFTFAVDEFIGDSLVASTTWRDMPTTPQTHVTLDVASDILSSSPLRLDMNGDGVVDYSFSPKINDSVIFTKPELIVHADPKSVMVGGSMPAFTATISGFVDGDTETVNDIVGTPDCITAATSTNTAGAYTITCSLGTLTSNKYTFKTFVSSELSISYVWSGFMQPINDTVYQAGQNISVFKAGSTVPVKFQLKDASGNSTQATIPPQWRTPEREQATSAKVDESLYSAQTSTGSAYKWDPLSRQYVYNWSTKGYASGYLYRIFAKLDDGSTRSVIIGLK